MALFTEYLNLWIVVVGAICCLIPLFILTDTTYKLSDKLEMMGISADRDPILLAFLFVIVVPAADLVIDLPSRTYSCFHRMKTPKSSKSETVFHLTDTERTLYIIGMAIQSTAWFIPTSFDIRSLGLVHICTRNFSRILIASPIIIFLQRCTTSFTALRTFIIVIFGVAGTLLSTSQYLFESHSISETSFYITGLALQLISGGGYFSLVFLSAYRSGVETLGTLSARRASWLWLSNLIRTEEMKLRMTDIDSSPESYIESYKNYVPALHMISSLLLTIGATYETYSLEPAQQTHLHKNIISLIAQIIVLLIEVRIRKIEVSRALVELLNSKKMYVRYISHELRTPLNTTVLGLQLLRSEFRNSNDAKDVERYDTLSDVNTSCVAAVDILNDLLCYEKLEFGLLDLHKEIVDVQPFLRGFLSMFSFQARACEVQLSMDTGKTSNEPFHSPFDTDCVIDEENQMHHCTNNSHSSSSSCKSSLSLLPQDVILIDRGKMDQVFRNLISNALKFTSPGGTVTIKATFVEDTPTVGDAKADSTAKSRRNNGNNLNGSNGNGTHDHDGCVMSRPLKRWVQLISNITGANFASSLQNICSDKRRVCNEPNSQDEFASAPHEDSVKGRLVVVVTDTGCGMSEESLKKYSDDNVEFNLETLQASGDSGLGLYISRGIVDLHDGKITILSAGEGRGSSFIVEIPMTRCVGLKTQPHSTHHHDSLVEQAEQPIRPCIPDIDLIRSPACSPDLEYRSSSSVQRSGTPSTVDTALFPLLNENTPSYNLLVVDDSFLNRKMLLKILRKYGHTCREAEDGEAAVAEVKKKMERQDGSGEPFDAFDAILMDYVMPNMDGPSATQAIRELGYKGSIFGVTGNGLPSDISHFLSCGADRVLLKPLSIATFSSAMRETKPPEDTESQVQGSRF